MGFLLADSMICFGFEVNEEGPFTAFRFSGFSFLSEKLGLSNAPHVPMLSSVYMSSLPMISVVRDAYIACFRHMSALKLPGMCLSPYVRTLEHRRRNNTMTVSIEGSPLYREEKG